jgi:hypothetical protein
MKYVPSILMALSFIIICVGVYLKSENSLLGLPLIIGGMIGEVIFLIMNRMLFNKNKRQA